MLTTSFATHKAKMEINSSFRSRDIKCLKCQGVRHIASQCPNKRAMILLDNGDIESESSSGDEIPPLENYSDVDVVEPINGDVLVTRRVLNILIIDSGSCTNVASILLVEKLGFPH